MIGHSARLEWALTHLPINVQTLVDWSPGRGQDWHPLTVISGQHASDVTQQYRWNCSGVFAKTYPVGITGINALGCRMRVRQAITAMGFGMEILPAGVYSITSLSNDENTLSLTGQSFETDCIDSTFPVARSFPSASRMTYRQQAEALILEAVPDATFIWDDAIGYDQPMPSMQVDSDRWGTIDGARNSSSILTSLGADGFCNSTGAFQFALTPTLLDAPVGTIQRGETLITPSLTQDRSGVSNLIVVTGTPADGSAVIGPVFVWDNDPTSITYAGPDPVNSPGKAGNFGVKPYTYDNPLITSEGQAKITGQGLLSKTLGAHETVSADARYNPYYEAGDVVAIENEAGILIPRLIDSIQTTWGSAKMSMSTRSPKEDVS